MSKNKNLELFFLGSLVENIIDGMEESEQRKLHIDDKHIFGLSTGYIRLDKITSGLQKSDLIILAARPSMGKTSFALNIARNVALEEQKTVVIFSLEMTKDRLSMRMLSSESRLDPNRLRSKFISQKDWQNVTDAANLTLNEIPIFINDTPHISVMEIRDTLREKLQELGDIGLIIIDNIQLMKPSNRFERRDLEIAEISQGLKALAKELDVPIMVLSQLNRMLEQRADKRPLLSDLRESGALEQDADIVLFIYRDQVYNKEPDNPRIGLAEVLVAKNRNGPTGNALMHFYEPYTRFEELTYDSYQG